MKKETKKIAHVYRLVHYFADILYRYCPISKRWLRIFVGVTIAYIGVIVSKFEILYVSHLVMDFVGYAIHGLGLIPVYKELEEIIWP